MGSTISCRLNCPLFEVPLCIKRNCLLALNLTWQKLTLLLMPKDPPEGALLGTSKTDNTSDVDSSLLSLAITWLSCTFLLGLGCLTPKSFEERSLRRKSPVGLVQARMNYRSVA
uniref:ATPase subunit 8 n=1 Tax=Rhizophora mucronata TaxID=61149 RepID=A0A2P2MUM9_RHIMU